jgi:hypothetical protein
LVPATCCIQGGSIFRGICLVFWSKAAKALSTTPSKGVAFAG